MMNVPLRTNLFGRQSHALAQLIAAFLTIAVLVEFADAQEKTEPEVTEPEVTEPAAAEVRDPNDPQSVPNKQDWREKRRERDEKALLIAPDGNGEREQTEQLKLQKAMRELQDQQQELQRRQNELAEQRAAMAKKIAQATVEMEQLRQEPDRLDRLRAMLDREMEMSRSTLQQLRAAQQQAQAAAAEDAKLHQFNLKYIRPHEIGDALTRITGGAGPRIAFDQRTNALVVSGNDKQITIVRQLVETLDQPGPVRQENAAETLQLRIVWLLDGLPEQHKEPTEDVINPRVLDALKQMGLKDPKAVCQQMTTLTLEPNNVGGQFQFEIPVLINAQRWQFQGKGTIRPMPDKRFNLQFDLDFRPSSSSHGKSEGQLAGSIYSPLGHYTVMGTTTFVAAETVPGDEGSVRGEQRQRLSAFVVYLDRAREFPETEIRQVDKEPLPEDKPDSQQ